MFSLLVSLPYSTGHLLPMRATTTSDNDLFCVHWFWNFMELYNGSDGTEQLCLILCIMVLLTLTSSNSTTVPLRSKSPRNTNKKSHTFRVNATSTCCSYDRKCLKSSWAPILTSTPGDMSGTCIRVWFFTDKIPKHCLSLAKNRATSFLCTLSITFLFEFDNITQFLSFWTCNSV